MRLLVSWLRDFVDVTASAEEIAETLGAARIRGRPSDRAVSAAATRVIDFEVTANRPDCLSVARPRARESPPLYDLPLTLPSTDPTPRRARADRHRRRPSGSTVTIEDAELCPRYAAAVAEVTAGDVAAPG